MLDFRKLKIDDKKTMDDFFKKSGALSMEYNFTTLFIWGAVYNSEIAIEDGMLFVRVGKDKYKYLFPCGDGDIKSAVEKILNMEKPLCFYGICEEHKRLLEEHFHGRFEFVRDRDVSDYVYTAESLANLKGKKLSSKRNHINRFVEKYPDWTYEEMGTQNIDEARMMHQKWCQSVDARNNPGLLKEGIAVQTAFDYFEKLELSGGLIRAGGEIVAFSIGDKLNDKTLLVHIEKAFHEINGAYPIINREFVRHNSQFEFVNREDDTGEEGLRRAKLSYQPCEIITKYYAKEIL